MQQLTQLRSPDLFTPEKQQIFCAKTGEYLGTVNEGENLPLTEKEKQQQQQIEADKNQIKLF